MQGTVVMLLALSGLGCHHKQCAPAYAETCYSSCYSGSSCYSSTCYSSGCYSSCYSGSSCYSSCYSGSSCYSSCYSGSSCYSSCYTETSCYSSCYTETSCYSSCYSGPKHKHGLFGHKRRSCSACCAPAPMPVAASCDPCSMGYSGVPVYGTYTPVYDGYPSGQYVGSGQSYTSPMSSQVVPAVKPVDAAPAAPAAPTPEAPSPGNPAPAPAAPTPAPVPPTPAPGATTPPTPPPAS